MYEMTLQRASFAHPPPDVISLLAALEGNQEQTDRWAGIDAGSVSPAEGYASEVLQMRFGIKPDQTDLGHDVPDNP